MRIIAVLFILAAPIPAFAAGDTPLATGLGMTTCSQFMRSVQSSPETENNYFEWAQGYMTAMNAMFGFTKTLPKDLTARPSSVEKNAIKGFCKSHPSEVYEAAVPAVYVLLPEMKKQQ